MFLNAALLLQQSENRRNLIAVLPDHRMHAVVEHPRHILIESAARDMAARLDRDTVVPDALQRVHVDDRWLDQCLAERLSQLIIVCIQTLLRHLKHFSDKGKAVAVHAARCDADQHIACPEIRTCDQILLVDHTHCKSRKVILILRHQSRMLRSLAADQCSAALPAALRHPFHDRRDLDRLIFPTGNIIEEEQRLTARTCDIVDTHRHTVYADRIVLIHQKCQLDLGPDPVRT